jgi:phosphoribosylformylglycinamidine cyclo-ligase
VTVSTYREAGVDLAGAEKHVENIGPLVKETWGDMVYGGFGGFAAGVEIPPGMKKPIIMMSTDGVGTKLELARKSDIWDGIGFDLVAMCVDDLAAVGARPIGFVDYMAVGTLRPDRDQRIVASIARACIAAGCPLLGGETAEHPGVMEPDAVDLAGAAMGVAERDALFDRDRVAVGDVVIGLRSPNLRSNGFSLVRKVLGDDYDYAAVLEPSVIYSPAVFAVASLVKSAAHITGGGIPGNLPRALPDGLGVTVDTGAWEIPAVFDDVAAMGVSEKEMFATFNMGIGFCLIAGPAALDDIVASVGDHDPVVLGTVTTDPGVAIV